MSQATLQRSIDRRLFPTAAILFALIVVAGFARSYYLKGFFGTPPMKSPLVHLHGLAMSAWVLLFGTQVYTDAAYCKPASVIWDKGDLSTVLQSRLDSLRRVGS